MLYFIKSQDYLKIGYSKSEKSLIGRIKDYRTHNPSFNILQITKEGDQKDETTLHHLLKNYQYYSEWFYDNQYVHKIWNNYTKDMQKIDVDEILLKFTDVKQYQENKVLNVLRDLEKELGEEYICKSAWDIKDIMFKIYRKYNMKGSPKLVSLEQFGYSHKRIFINKESYIKVFKLKEY